MLGSPRDLGFGDESPQVPGRSDISGRPSGRQQTLGRDSTLCRLDPLRDELGELVVVMASFGSFGHRADLGGVDDPLHRAGRHAAERGRPSITPKIAIGGDHVHTFPR